MSELYSPLFCDIAHKRAEADLHPAANSSFTDSFMDLARLIRAFIYGHMKVPKELCEVPEVGVDKNLDKELREYMQRTKHMNKNNVSVPSVAHS